MNKLKKTIHNSSDKKILITFVNKICRIYEKVFTNSIYCNFYDCMP